MGYLLTINGKHYFNRRVPKLLREYDKRECVRIALNTDSLKDAHRLAVIQNDAMEEYWKDLVAQGKKHQFIAYENAVLKARLLCFSYKTNEELSQGSLQEIYRRLVKLNPHNMKEKEVIAVLGGIEQPQVKLQDLLNHYVSNSKGRMLNKSSNQVRKWLNPRKLAMKTLLDSVGNKVAKDFTREDMIKYRDWWIGRIEQDAVATATANKNLITVATIIKSVNKSVQLKLDPTHIFEGMLLPEDSKTQRLPFTTDFIRNDLLNNEKLKRLNAQASWVLHAMAETGAGVSELVGILPEEIILDDNIPHIIIAPRHKKALKTKYRKRTIPLVGYALDAFRACPEGFTEYRDRPDSLSTHLSKFLRENDILPSENHSVYSLRHSFQDRLLAANAPDRLQADLMGHKFTRPYYGDGASLSQKLEYLQRIQIKP